MFRFLRKESIIKLEHNEWHAIKQKEIKDSYLRCKEKTNIPNMKGANEKGKTKRRKKKLSLIFNQFGVQMPT